MRILHFNHYGSNAGGAEGYIADVSAALAAAGHVSRLVSFAAEEASQLMPGAVPVGGGHIGSVLARIQREITDFRPDAAYLHAVYEPKVVQWIADRLPAVAYVHGPYPVCPGYAQFLRQSSRVCPYSAGPGCLLRAQTEQCCSAEAHCATGSASGRYARSSRCTRSSEFWWAVASCRSCCGGTTCSRQRSTY